MGWRWSGCSVRLLNAGRLVVVQHAPTVSASTLHPNRAIVVGHAFALFLPILGTHVLKSVNIFARGG